MQLAHFTATEGGIPPSNSKVVSSQGYVIDSIIFGFTWRLKVLHTFGGIFEDVLINTPHIPTDNWNPAYIVDREVSERNFNEYTSELSAWLSKMFNYKINVKGIKVVESKILNTRKLLEEVYRIFYTKILDYSGENKEYYSTLVLGELYNLFFLGKSQEIVSARQEIKIFLQGKIQEYEIQLFGENVPEDFRSIKLDQSHMAYWRSKNLDKDFLRSFRVSPRDTSDIDVFSIINNLKEPISELGKVLKDTAISFGNPTQGNPKKLYLIPLKAYNHGFAQYGDRRLQDDYTKTTTSTIKIDGINWNCWELDGTSETRLKEFGNLYKNILRGLLEGQLHFFLWSYDTVSGETEFVGNFGILGGAINKDQLHFSSKRKYRAFSSISSYEENFHNAIERVINIFMRSQLPLTPVTRNSLKYYNFIF
ncbi:hypothetical protein LCGC14_2534490 [marine sediment metagenome]|uniref:Uncharacterized protein n=1 Tax=marine sediment metagenome TaxID=412755 RepID=A0A0F9D418_9ZZZZ